jgi:hypothetical protein
MTSTDISITMTINDKRVRLRLIGNHYMVMIGVGMTRITRFYRIDDKRLSGLYSQATREWNEEKIKRLLEVI